MSEEVAAKAAHAEAEGRVKVLTIGEGDDQIVLEIPRKWKRFKFMRALKRGDIAGAVDAIWPPTVGEDGEEVPHPSVAKLEEADLEDDEFDGVLEVLAKSLGGTSAGNSQASPIS